MGTTQMWDYTANHYRNFTQLQLRLNDASRYWANYDGPPKLPHMTMSTKLGNYWPYIYGVATDAGQDRRIVPRRLKNFIRDVADDSFGLPDGDHSGKAFLSTFYFGGGGFKSSGSNFDRKMEFGRWADSAFHELLSQYQNTRPHGMTIVWSTRDVQTNTDVMRDAYRSRKI